jgi:hypothetical protein
MCGRQDCASNLAIDNTPNSLATDSLVYSLSTGHLIMQLYTTNIFSDGLSQNCIRMCLLRHSVPYRALCSHVHESLRAATAVLETYASSGLGTRVLQTTCLDLPSAVRLRQHFVSENYLYSRVNNSSCNATERQINYLQ